MELTIRILDKNGGEKARATGQGSVSLVYTSPYEEGDVLSLAADAPGFVVARLEDSMPEAYGLLRGSLTLPVPFGEKRVSYSPKSFMGDMHLLTARAATEEETHRRRNLALNPLDCHENTGLFPHASANVETRGEAVFAARNAIDGNTESRGHGNYPYESWGINQNPGAEIKIDFGRPVQLDELVITLRADFPHDNWWKTATLRFSDGSSFSPAFQKTGAPQRFPLEKRRVEWVTMGGLIKDETDPSPFPALTQMELWGREVFEK